MKHILPLLTCFLAMQLYLHPAAYAQISISSADYLARLNIAVQTADFGSSDTTRLASVISNAGAGKTWDLTGRAFAPTGSSTSTLLEKAGSGAPQQTVSAFTTATHVVKHKSPSEPWTTNWTYESVTESAMYYHGNVEDSLGVVIASQTNTPKWKSTTFPATYETSWAWSSTVKSTTYKPSGSVSAAVDMNGSDIIDGYGTVKTPEGSFACLRLKSKSNILFGFFTITSYSYEFMDQNRSYARISADETGKIPEGVTYYRLDATTGFDKFTDKRGVFGLSQNFPNPFSRFTLIEYYLPRSEFVTLRVYNRLGCEVSLLVNEYKLPGKYTAVFEAQHLPCGVYFYCLQAGPFTQTRKLIVTR